MTFKTVMMVLEESLFESSSVFYLAASKDFQLGAEKWPDHELLSYRNPMSHSMTS